MTSVGLSGSMATKLTLAVVRRKLAEATTRRHRLITFMLLMVGFTVEC